MLTTLLLAPALAATAPASPPAANRCAAPGADRVTVRPARPTRARPLNEMPPARGMLTVYRRVDGCPVLLVRDGGLILKEWAGRPDQRRVFRP